MKYQDPQTRLRRMKLLAPTILEAATRSGECKERVMALAWRESWCSFAPGFSPVGDPCGFGDGGNGFGVFQIDKRYHGPFVNAELGRAREAGDKYTPLGQAIYACGVLRTNREYFRRSASSVHDELLERSVYAAYNAGPYSVYKQLIRNQPVDAITTGKDYSDYIFKLAKILQDPAYKWLWL